MKFFDQEGSADWIKKLDKSFENFFIENVPILKMTKEAFDVIRLKDD